LTNALTGWEPPRGPRAQLPLFPELAQERDAAECVKQQVPILVVIGNPPYNAFAGTSPDEEEGLVEPYKEGLSSVWHIRKYNLDELYVRFLRIGERRITATGRGIVCYISNYWPASTNLRGFDDSLSSRPERRRRSWLRRKLS
jgi:predicted helicase